MRKKTASAGLPAGEQASTRDLIREARYQFTWQVSDGVWAYCGPNQAHDLSISLAADGFHAVRYRTEGELLGDLQLSLPAYFSLSLGGEGAGHRPVGEGEMLHIIIDAADALYPLIVDPLLHSQPTKLMASDAEDDDRFGWSVAISGDIAVVGAHWGEGTGTNRGAAYIYRLEPLAQPEIMVSPGNLDFGEQGMGSVHLLRTVSITNDGDGDEPTVNTALSGTGVLDAEGLTVFLPLVFNND